ncbi:HNH endonuclease [Nocardioides sp. TRM66260-LWL]|uniref:HNH endonuclease n=1 Tax=Nocardioides sp. TRM66260-LWL TaxID=2874478 RepID=UPI001CC5D840|nr:HNH endonuclease [Nocardioides sp. TRM66260-LWL]MBZ5736470.1 HNH endonuclease [Nocardioides sp. TRM66260-LWL]
MTARTTISKRLRFAVLTRENFTCHYCGASKDDGVKLTVDHVIPVALGGSDEPSNLVSACEPCNSGKTSTAPTEGTVAAVNAAAITWATAMQIAAQEAAQARAALDGQIDHWHTAWNAWGRTWNDGTREHVPLPDGWRNSISALLEAGADLDALVGFIRVAMTSKAAKTADDAIFKYFCGCGWKHVKSLQARALQLLDADAVVDQALDLDQDHISDSIREAYWAGHRSGYAAGHEDGWESGIAAGKASADTRRQTNDEPLSLAQIIQPPPKDE